MIIEKPTLVVNRKSGLKYLLIPKGDDSYYMSCNDGIVPSGQMIYRTPEELDELFVLGDITIKKRRK